MERKAINTSTYIDFDDFFDNRNTSSLIEYLESLGEKHGNQARFEYEENDCCVELKGIGRLETDEEMVARIKAEIATAEFNLAYYSRYSEQYRLNAEKAAGRLAELKKQLGE